MDPTCVFNFFTFFERILCKSNCIIFIFSWCATHTKIRSKLVVIVTAGSQKFTLWGPQRTPPPLGILRVNRVYAVTPCTFCVEGPAVDVDCCAKFPSCYGTNKTVLLLLHDPAFSHMNPVHTVVPIFSRTFCDVDRRGAVQAIPCLHGTQYLSLSFFYQLPSKPRFQCLTPIHRTKKFLSSDTQIVDPGGFFFSWFSWILPGKFRVSAWNQTTSVYYWMIIVLLDTVCS